MFSKSTIQSVQSEKNWKYIIAIIGQISYVLDYYFLKFFQNTFTASCDKCNKKCTLKSYKI